jgi:serine protease
MAQAQLGYRFSPRTLRGILSDHATGTASATPETDRIGVVTNLDAIVTGVLNAIEDVYVRDHVGDSGDPHSGPISASPDIIARPSPVSDPQAAFGQGSGTENEDALGCGVEAGQDNYIYVRTRNRGGVGAANVVATVYWAPVATLVTPNLWTLIDSVTIPSVPTGNQLTVSDAIVWPAASIPASGHYCFVGLVGTAADPAPGLAAFSDWANLTTFISANNNVTWRNFNVVNDVPPSGGKPPGFVRLRPDTTETPSERRKGLLVLPAGEVLWRDVVEKVLELFDDLAGVLHLVLELDRGLRDHVLRGEDRRIGAHGNGESVGGARVDRDFAAVQLEDDLGVESVLT